MKIGIFDSGVGGLSVVKELLKKKTDASLIYLGDTARFPYGTKSPETIQRYAIENTLFLLEKGADVIVVACNTATAHALKTLRSMFSLPIFGVIEPAVQMAKDATKNGKIGVIATKGAIKSKNHFLALKALLPNAEIFPQATPLLVSIIEDGSPNEAIKKSIIKAYLAPMRRKKIDTLLLGCTHYPLIRPYIEEELKGISIIDPAEACANTVHSFLQKSSDRVQCKKLVRFYVTDDPKRFKQVGEAFLGFPIGKVHLITR